ncbi:MAG: SsrA-binding protein [Gammaproteobacteria bacterium]|nr:SsrA-binding protein [Gammaproteobacteria bacterium]|tara:strand:- start:986 stop:1435 length:450 start_codon:yes stop_codon:yes gene_type:complete
MNILCSNKKASFRYSLTNKIEAGLVLEGWEVKSIKSGHGQISESYVTLLNNEFYLVNSHLKVLPNYSNAENLDPARKRKILLTKKEILDLKDEIKINGNSIIPVKIYSKKSLVKIQIAVGKGKKARDKRQTIKDREWSRNKERILKKKY